jgi:hypothetical protein
MQPLHNTSVLPSKQCASTKMAWVRLFHLSPAIIMSPFNSCSFWYTALFPPTSKVLKQPCRDLERQEMVCRQV